MANEHKGGCCMLGGKLADVPWVCGHAPSGAVWELCDLYESMLECKWIPYSNSNYSWMLSLNRGLSKTEVDFRQIIFNRDDIYFLFHILTHQQAKIWPNSLMGSLSWMEVSFHILNIRCAKIIFVLGAITSLTLWIKAYILLAQPTAAPLADIGVSPTRPLKIPIIWFDMQNFRKAATSEVQAPKLLKTY